MTTMNQRKIERNACLVPIEGKEGGAFCDICSVDISRGGMGFISRCKLPLKKKIAVEVELGPDKEPVVMLGEVRWVHSMAQVKNYRIGMKFIKVLASGSRSRLAEYFEEKE